VECRRFFIPPHGKITLHEAKLTKSQKGCEMWSAEGVLFLNIGIPPHEGKLTKSQKGCGVWKVFYSSAWVSSA
jgi:hypothetical protein